MCGSAACDRVYGPLRFGERRRPASLPPLEYLKLHESPGFSIGVFCFPAAAVIPLHNHPHMTVISKLLYGTVHVRSFDWVHAEEGEGAERTPPGTPRLARLVADRQVEGGEPHMALYPSSGGNLHCFTAITAAALLDILAPPYAVGGGRDCHYFKEVPWGPRGEAPGAREAWLSEVECPEDFSVTRGAYDGPKVGSEADR